MGWPIITLSALPLKPRLNFNLAASRTNTHTLDVPQNFHRRVRLLFRTPRLSTTWKKIVSWLTSYLELLRNNPSQPRPYPRKTPLRYGRREIGTICQVSQRRVFAGATQGQYRNRSRNDNTSCGFAQSSKSKVITYLRSPTKMPSP